MNDNDLVLKYKNLFFRSNLFLNWNEDFIIKNIHSPKMFVVIFVKNTKNLIGFKISIVKEEKDISVYWQGEEDKFFELSDEGFMNALDTITKRLEIIEKN